MDLPLERIHSLAFKAAEASHCAGDQDKYWEMHDRLFVNQRNLEPWDAHAAALGLDVEAFQACLDEGEYVEAVRRDMAEAAKVGATGTPSFVLGRTDPADPSKVEGISFIRGAQAFPAFQSHVDAALKALESGE